MNWLFYVLSAGAGFANPAQSGANAQLKKTFAHPVWATVAVYGPSRDNFPQRLVGLDGRRAEHRVHHGRSGFRPKARLRDHFGWIGFEKHPASAVRIAGCALVICGLWLVAKF